MQNQPQSIMATDSQIPRPEHPRPDFQRDHWINLNGRWRFTFDPRDVGEQMRWYRVPHPARGSLASTDPSQAFNTGPSTGALMEDPFGDEIVVPFPWESQASTINEPDYKGAGWYQRVLIVPAEWAEASPGGGPLGAVGLPGAEDAATSATGANVRWRRHPYLCFGAVDWNAKVWVDGRFAGEHDGGYSSFALDLSQYVRPGHPATLTVRAWDTAAADTPVGKQTPRWYTHSSGIWQTVWLEGRAPAHITNLHITPHLEDGRAAFDVRIASARAAAAGTYRLSVTSTSGLFPAVDVPVEVAGDVTQRSVDVQVPQPRAWSPEDPHLYDCLVTLAPATADRGAPPEPDRVQTYFGLRTISKGVWEDRPYEYVFLNGEPIYLRGALDQALHPEALHAYPTDEAIRADVQAAKDLGLNLLRCHIKINDPRYYYWCDKLGMLCMYDLPSASIYTPKARANWEATFREALERDFSHPSIFAWILFNETWGLEEHQTPASWQWVKEMYLLAKQLDPTRLVEDNSACLYDHVDTDINTWHFYINEYDRARRHVERVVQQTYPGSAFNYVGSLYRHVDESRDYLQKTQPLLNSEYGGIGARDGDVDVAYCLKYLTSELRRHDKICGYVYTELADIEWEHNGFLNYDRTHKEFGYGTRFPGMTVADLNGADFVGLDCPPCQTLAPGATFSAPAFVSHWNRRALSRATLRWQVTAVDRFGEPLRVAEGKRPVTPRHYGVTNAGSVEVTLPDNPCVATIMLWLEDQEGRVRARNYVDVEVYEASERSTVERTGTGYALRFQPGDFVDASWPNPRLGARGAKFGASEAGWVDYAVTLPQDVKASAVSGLRVRFEAAARTARSRIGWKDPHFVKATDYPQTEERKVPTDLQVSVNGVLIGQVRLPDDPADAAGVLSAYLSEHWEPSSYGFLTTLDAGTETARRALAEAREGQLVVRFEVPRTGRRGGLNLYGARMGAYPLDPTVFIDL